MTATILPADGMIDVLSDAIASKRDTIALLERAAKDAQADLQHLREVRAVRLARAAGFEVGQVWIVKTYNRDSPGVIFAIESGWQESGSNDWKIIFLFEKDGRRDSNFDDVDGSSAQKCCVGRIDGGPILDGFAALLRAANEQKEKAA